MRQDHKRPLTALLILLPALTLAQTDADDNAQGGAQIQLAQAAGGDSAAQYDAVLKQTEGLEVYNALLQRQIAAQQQEIENLRAAIEVVPALERQVPPLLIRMVDGLVEFVRLDVPFLSEEREERVTDLQLLMERSDVNDAEKFRRILEAWQIETEYGSSFTTYVDQLEVNGASREVEMLQVGRVALLFQTNDEEAITGAWDPDNNNWIQLPSEHRNSVQQALRMARNQIAPELVLLPIRPAE